MECGTETQRLDGFPDQTQLEVDAGALGMQVVVQAPVSTGVLVNNRALQQIDIISHHIGIGQLLLISLETPVVQIEDAEIKTEVNLVGNVAAEADIVLVGMTTLVHLIVGVACGTIAIKTLHQVSIGIDDAHISAVVGLHVIGRHCSPWSIAIKVGVVLVVPIKVCFVISRHIDELVGDEVTHRGGDVAHAADIVTVEGLETIVGETKVEVGYRLTVETDSAYITHIIHIELSLVELVHTGLGAIEVQAEGDTQVGVTVNTDTSRVLSERREIASEGSEGPRHRLEARGTPEFGLRHLQDIKSVLSVYQERKSAQQEGKNFLLHSFKMFRLQ